MVLLRKFVLNFANSLHYLKRKSEGIFLLQAGELLRFWTQHTYILLKKFVLLSGTFAGRKFCGFAFSIFFANCKIKFCEIVKKYIFQ